jgi:hypothetical protein
MGGWMYRSTFSDLSTSWRLVVSFTTRTLYPQVKSPGTHWIGGWVNPRAGLDDMERRKFLTLPGLELRPLGRPARSQLLDRLRSCNEHVKLPSSNFIFVRMWMTNRKILPTVRLRMHQPNRVQSCQIDLESDAAICFPWNSSIPLSHCLKSRVEWNWRYALRRYIEWEVREIRLDWTRFGKSAGCHKWHHSVCASSTSIYNLSWSRPPTTLICGFRKSSRR